MRSLIWALTAAAALHLALPLFGDEPTKTSEFPPPEVKFNTRIADEAKAQGISQETLDSVAEAIREYGVSFDLGDEARFRAAVSGDPGVIEMAVASMHTEQAWRATMRLVNQKLLKMPEIRAARLSYPRTADYRNALQQAIAVKGDDRRVSVWRPGVPVLAFVVERTPRGWRVVVGAVELAGVSLAGVPPEKATEILNQQREAYEQIRLQIADGGIKTFEQFAKANGAAYTDFQAKLEAAKPEPGPPEVKFSPSGVAQAKAAGITEETLDAAAKAIQEYGVSFDLDDEARHREAITGPPAMIEIAIIGMRVEKAKQAANELAREKLPGLSEFTDTTDRPKRNPYPWTSYHRNVLDDSNSSTTVLVTGDNQRVTITREVFKDPPEYVVEKTPRGWRVAVREDRLRGVPPEKVAEILTRQLRAYEQMKQKVADGHFKTFREYLDAMRVVRAEQREQARAATPTTAPANP